VFTLNTISSADLNPIGSFSKIDLKSFLEWGAAKENLGYSTLLDVINATPTAELEPITTEYTQSDEGRPNGLVFLFRDETNTLLCSGYGDDLR